MLVTGTQLTSDLRRGGAVGAAEAGGPSLGARQPRGRGSPVAAAPPGAPPAVRHGGQTPHQVSRMGSGGTGAPRLRFPSPRWPLSLSYCVSHSFFLSFLLSLTI